MAEKSLNSLTTSYAGEFAGKYISAALLSGTTLAEEKITVKPNVKFKEVMKKIATTSFIKNATCDFSGEDDIVTITENILTPEEFQVNLELCKKDFVNDWEAVQMGYSAYHNMPPAFSDFLLAHVADKVAQQIEQTIWNGANATEGEFDGFVTTLGADGTVNDVTTDQTVISASNVIAELGKVADLIPSTVYGKEDLAIYVGADAHRAYIRALGGFSVAATSNAGTDNKGTQWYAGSGLTFDGINIEYCPGIPTGKIIAAEKSNLFFGTGLLADTNEVKVLDMADLNGSQNVRIIMRYTAGIQHGIGSDIVLYETV
jgi:hypothetical protein